jgi:hypothetical protein
MGCDASSLFPQRVHHPHAKHTHKITKNTKSTINNDQNNASRMPVNQGKGPTPSACNKGYTTASQIHWWHEKAPLLLPLVVPLCKIRKYQKPEEH